MRQIPQAQRRGCERARYAHHRRLGPGKLQQTGRTYSSLCDAVFCDARCGGNFANHP